MFFEDSVDTNPTKRVINVVKPDEEFGDILITFSWSIFTPGRYEDMEVWSNLIVADLPMENAIVNYFVFADLKPYHQPADILTFLGDFNLEQMVFDQGEWRKAKPNEGGIVP